MDGRSRRTDPQSAPPARPVTAGCESDLRRPSSYLIRVEGHLDERPAAWPIGTVIDRLPDGDTVLTAPEVDQAALHGLLRTLRDLGVRLVSVNATGSGQAEKAMREGQQ